MFNHITDAIEAPAIIHLDTNLFVARFEAMKVYSTVAAVERLLQAGVIERGDTLVDSSSGLYAQALALACHKFGMKCLIVASKTINQDLLTQLHVLGATVERVEPAASLKLDQSYRVKRIKALLRDDPSMHWMQQYHDDIHYAGYEPVADLIRDEIGVEWLTIVGAVGSGASTGGLATSLRAHDDNVELIGVQPFGSVTFGSEQVVDPEIIIAGFGSSIPFRNVRHELYDHIHWASFEYGVAGTIALFRRHAVFAGLSSGCCYLVARHEAVRRPDRRVLFIAADTGHRYVSSVFARHHDVRDADVDALTPTTIATLDELALPWSAMAWNRRAPVDVPAAVAT